MPDPQLAWEDTWDGLVGFRVEASSGERAKASFEVQTHHKQSFGVVHGGVYSSLAEGLCSAATWQAHGGAKIVMGTSNHTSFLRPVFDGTVTVEAVAKHSGRTTAVWEAEFRDGEGKLCALTRVSLAIRDSGS